MPSLPIRDFGRGRNTAQNASLLEPGEARDSLNLYHNQSVTTCKRRDPWARVWATRPANAVVLAAWDLVKSDLTTIKMAKIGSVLYTFTNTFATALTSIKTGLNSTALPGYAFASGLAFIADGQTTNYTSDGTANGTTELQKAAGSDAAITLASAGTATGNAAGTVYYSYTSVNLYDGAESPPCTAKSVTRTADQGVTVTNASLSFTTPWTTVKLYRTKAGETQFYFVASGLTSGSFPYADTSLDTALTTVSEVHGDEVLTSDIEKPEAAKHTVFHKGRIYLANLTSLASRIRWSKLIEPTQFRSSTSSRFNIGKDDGTEITAVVSFRGSLVVFKTHSIWIGNGDIDETTFTFTEAVVGIGCIAQRTVVVDGDRGIYFLSAQGVFRYDIATLAEVALSDKIAPDVAITALNPARYDYMCAGIDPGERLYLLSVAPTGVVTNTKTYAFSLETGSWGRFDWSMGKVTPSCYSNSGRTGPIKDSNAAITLCLGDEQGFLYRPVPSGTHGDGSNTGDQTGTVTSSTATTVTCTTAAFMTTGTGLTGLSVTLRRAVDNSYETQTIVSATATVITVASWTGTAPVADDKVIVGAYQSTLSLGRFDADTDQRKRFDAIRAGIQKQTHTTPLRVGYTLDGDTAPTASREYTMSGFVARWAFHRRGQAVSPYFDIIGVGADGFELLSLEVEIEVIGSRRPVR